MSQQITIVQLEAVINRLLLRRPSGAAELSPVLILLAEAYARMIYHRLPLIDIAALPEDCRGEVRTSLNDASD